VTARHAAARLAAVTAALALLLALVARLAPTASADEGGFAIASPLVAADPPPVPPGPVPEPDPAMKAEPKEKEPKEKGPKEKGPKEKGPKEKGNDAFELTMDDLEDRLLSRPAAAAAMYLSKFGVAIAGLVVLIVWWGRANERRKGMLPPVAPDSPPPAPFGLAPSMLLALVAVFGGGVVLSAMQRLGAAGETRESVTIPQTLLAVAACMVPVALVIYAGVRRRRDEAAALAVLRRGERTAADAFGDADTKSGSHAPAADGLLRPPPWRAGKSAWLGFLTWVVSGAVVLGLYLVSVAFVWFVLERKPVPQDLIVRLVDSKTSTPDFLWAALYGTVLAPITEECIFRGALFPAIRDVSTPTTAALVSAALFSAVHMDLMAALPLFGLATMLAWSYQRSGSLVAPIVVHMLNNATSLLPLLLLRA
jgi:membrane protease YdiL (CAAX protease family)